MDNQQYDNNLKCGLWVKESKKTPGLKYSNGRISIAGKEYWVSIFRNDKRDNPNAPDQNMVLNEVQPK